MTTPSLRLKDKVALVTGGSRGIGAAIALRLAQEGSTVALTYSASPKKAQEVVQTIESSGGKALAIQADSAKADEVKNSITKTVQAFGRLDILVNNAGIAAMGPLETFSIEDFDRLLAINIKAVFVASQEAARHLKEGGRIINIGSCTADRMSMAGGAPYAMTKAAVASLTRGIARDLGPRGITVNNVQPGPIDTDMNPANGGAAADQMRSESLLGRYGKAEEVASMVAYLASPESAFVTGASISVDGGINC